MRALPRRSSTGRSFVASPAGLAELRLATCGWAIGRRYRFALSRMRSCERKKVLQEPPQEARISNVGAFSAQRAHPV